MACKRKTDSQHSKPIAKPIEPASYDPENNDGRAFKRRRPTPRIASGTQLHLDDGAGAGQTDSKSINGPTTTPPKKTSSGGNGVKAAEASARAFEGREYMAALTPPPRATLYGDAMSGTSTEALAWSANQASPILRLPLKVRRNIYEYALGGNSILVKFSTYCTKKGSNGRDQCVPDMRYRSNAVVELGSTNSKSSRLELSLLNVVCRQLCYETHTLPYSLNNFSFPLNTLFNFLVMEDRLQSQQRKAITSITVLGQLPGQAVLGKLPKLKGVFLADAEATYEEGQYEVVKVGKMRKLIAKDQKMRKRIKDGERRRLMKDKKTPKLVKDKGLAKPTARGVLESNGIDYGNGDSRYNLRRH